jgi:hypothetical protein
MCADKGAEVGWGNCLGCPAEALEDSVWRSMRMGVVTACMAGAGEFDIWGFDLHALQKGLEAWSVIPLACRQQSKARSTMRYAARAREGFQLHGDSFFRRQGVCDLHALQKSL